MLDVVFAGASEVGRDDAGGVEVRTGSDESERFSFDDSAFFE